MDFVKAETDSSCERITAQTTDRGYVECGAPATVCDLDGQSFYCDRCAEDAANDQVDYRMHLQRLAELRAEAEG